MKPTSHLLSLGAVLCFAASAAAQDAPPTDTKAGAPDNHTVREGDTLWDLSGKYMNSSYEWPRLWSYNPEITNPHWIYPGHLLRLREGAEGGYAVAPPGEEGAGGPPAKGFGSGFGQMFDKNARWRGGTVIVGEEVYLDKDALERSGMIVGSPEEQMLMSPSDQVYIRFGKSMTPNQGQEFSLFLRLHRTEVNPMPSQRTVRTYKPEDGGEIVRVMGVVRIDNFDDKERIARATILEARDPIERGFEVTDVPSRMAQVPPKTNDRKIESRVIASNQALGMLAQGQLVFIDAGKDKGVQVGNRFFVVRRGDDWRQHLTLKEDLTGELRPDTAPVKDSKLPWEIIAEARVLYVRPQTCTAVITGSLVQVEPGDRVEMREGY
jgi:hypothetical protein